MKLIPAGTLTVSHWQARINLLRRDVRLTEAGRSFRRQNLNADLQSELSR
jgi:hypothetical protein